MDGKTIRLNMNRIIKKFRVKILRMLARIRFGVVKNFTKESRLYKVSEICNLLGIVVPEECSEIKNYYVTKTSLFDGLENKDQLIGEIKKRDGRYTYYNRYLRIRARRFKSFYNEMNFSNHSSHELLQLFINFLYVFKPFGYTYADYFRFELYRRTLAEANQFITWNYRSLIFQICNNPEYNNFFNDKVLFNKTFNEFINRDWLYTGTCSLQEFKEFIKKHPVFFAKPCNSMKGKGACILEFNNNAEQLYLECQKNNMIIEEIQVNFSTIKEFNKSSLNTVRVYTLLAADNEPIIISTAIRFGRKGSVVDNVGSGGIVALIDIDTGKIISSGRDRKHILYEKHPDSLKILKGFQIPKWEEVIKITKKTARLVPQIRLVGWDIAIKADLTIELIEGNHDPDFHVIQEPDQIGKKHLLEEHLNKLTVLQKISD